MKTQEGIYTVHLLVSPVPTVSFQFSIVKQNKIKINDLGKKN